MQCFLPVVLMLFCVGAGCGVDLLQLPDGKGCLLGILSLKGVVKVGEFRLALPQLCDDEAHLVAPVSHVDVPQHLVSHEPADTLNALPDDGGAEMSHMERLGHIGSAVVDEDRLGCAALLHSQLSVLPHLIQIACYIFIVQFDIDEAGLHYLHRQDAASPPHLGYHVLGDHKGSFFVGPRSRHGAVALVLAQVRPVGQGDLGVGAVIPRRLKRLFHLFRDHIYQLFHSFSSIPAAGMPSAS